MMSIAIVAFAGIGSLLFTLAPKTQSALQATNETVEVDVYTVPQKNTRVIQSDTLSR